MTHRARSAAMHVALMLLAVTALVAATFVVPGVAFAYNETDAPFEDCADCHGGDPSASSAGLHGGYMTTTSRCQTCHSVHWAPDGSIKLLPGPTVRSMCEACHDGTGGAGVYGSIAAQGLAPVARHRVDETNYVPGGSEEGSGTVAAFSGEGGNLSCNDCHSVHGSDLVEPFLGDRARVSSGDPAEWDVGVERVSSKLLRSRPTGGDVAVQHYGSDWCGACHKGRLAASEAHNHPTDSLESSTAPGWEPFHYDNVALIESPTTTRIDRMGRSNRGYLMPYPRTADQQGHAPICQQCHEDARTLGTISTVTEEEWEYEFTLTAPDGGDADDNPRFQVFPHESLNPGFLVEVGDDLCTNCHNP